MMSGDVATGVNRYQDAYVFSLAASIRHATVPVSRYVTMQRSRSLGAKTQQNLVMASEFTSRN